MLLNSGAGIGRAAALSLLLVLAGCNGGGGGGDSPAAAGDNATQTGNSAPQGASTTGDTLTASNAWRPAKPAERDWPGKVLEILAGIPVDMGLGFAIVAAAGELATHYGLTGWATGEAVAAAMSCALPMDDMGRES